MTLTPLMTAPIEIQIHAGAALLALTLGPVAIYRTRRDMLHKAVGYTWVLAIVTAALSSFFISGFGVVGPFSPLHLLALLTLWSVFEGMRYIFAGNIEGHRAAMQSLYWNGLLIAGLFNFLPGRTMNRTFLASWPELGYAVIALGLTGLVVRALWLRRTARLQAA